MIATEERDASLDDSANLPDPQVLAEEIATDHRSAREPRDSSSSRTSSPTCKRGCRRRRTPGEISAQLTTERLMTYD